MCYDRIEVKDGGSGASLSLAMVSMKSTFFKYVLAFAVIIVTSFVVLSLIITSMIRSYAADEREERLTITALTVSKSVQDNNVSDLKKYVETKVPSIKIQTMVERDPDIDVILLSPSGEILLTTVGAHDEETGSVTPITYQNSEKGLGNMEISSFRVTENMGSEFYVREGFLYNGGDLPYLIYGTDIRYEGTVCGYALALSHITGEDNLIATTQRVVFTSSLLVMLAAMIAVYFMTQKIIQPLRNMTTAAKTFAKGDFSARVKVYGKDEVAELGGAFNNMAESLENYDKMRNSFLASVSHDLRTPMTTIAGFIDGINSGAIPPEKQEHYLGLISSEVHRLSRLVSELLDVSRLQSGERKFVFADFDITEVSRLILISFEQKINEKGLDVVFDAEEDRMFAYGDQDAVYQVLYNLCHNAIKFAKEGGRFSIAIRRTEGKKITVSVYDEGLAVSREEAPHIFEQFYKVDQSRGLDKQGVGLGLYICKTIMDAHGERIWLTPDLSDGSEFCFTLKEGTAQPRKRRLPGDGER